MLEFSKPGASYAWRTRLAILRRLAKYEPFNTSALRQRIAQKTTENGE